MHAYALGLRDAAGVNLIDVEKESGTDIHPQLYYMNRIIDIVSEARARLGAYQNRLEFTSSSVAISSENLSDAESRIRNADMAREMMDFTQMNVLFQAGMMMLAQANQLPNKVLQLLQN